MPAVASQRRTLYHSKLREISELGPIVAEFSSKPRPSKFRGRPDFCHVIIDGQELEYQVENEAISEQLEDVPLRTPVRIQALGTKEAASLVVEVTNAPATAKAPPQQATCSRGYWEALDVAVALVEQFKKRHRREPSEAERTIAATLYIEFNRSGKPLTKSAR